MRAPLYIGCKSDVVIENYKCKLPTGTIQQPLEVDEIQWARRGLPNMEHSFLCLCKSQGPLRNLVELPDMKLALRDLPMMRKRENTRHRLKQELQLCKRVRDAKTKFSATSQ